MKIAVLFDGAGLARLGLEQAGHDCTGFELDPAKHYLSQMVGSGNCVLADVRDVDLGSFDAVWASPPCQEWSDQDHGNRIESRYSDPDLLWWSLGIPKRWPNIKTLWVENVLSAHGKHDNEWGTKFNAVQFLAHPIQKRRRIIGGIYKMPHVYRPFQWNYPNLDVCPAVVASEVKQGGKARIANKERRKATRWYGRPLSIREMSYHQGLDVPDELLQSWFYVPPFVNPKTGKLYTDSQWKKVLSSAIGNGVPVYMARAFGEAYGIKQVRAIEQLRLFEVA